MEPIRKTIHATVWNPQGKNHLFKTSANDRAECKHIECSNSENCSLFKNKQCTYYSSIGWERCPYGGFRREDGPTKRSQKCSKWSDEKKELYKGVLNYLQGSPPNKIAYIGEYVYLPYAHATLNKEIPFLEHNLYFNKSCCFLPKEHWNVAAVLSFVNFRAQSLMGGEITNYQTKEVPKFLADLSEVDQKLFNEFSTKHPSVLARYNTIKNPIGRKALLKTVVAPSDLIINDKKWVWKGGTLKSVDSSLLFLVGINNQNGNSAIANIVVEVCPKDDAVVKITDINHVNEQTIFVD